jgi:hypothetical protein
MFAKKLRAHSFLGKERGADGGIHATVDQNNFRRVLQNAKSIT